MSQAIVRSAFEQRIATWAAGKGMPVAYENVPFTPPAGPYCRAFIVPNSTQSLDLEGRHRAYRGFFQVTLVMPVGRGAGAGEALAAELDALFPVSTPMVVGGLRIYITSPMSPARAIVEGDRYAIPVAANYSANTI